MEICGAIRTQISAPIGCTCHYFPRGRLAFRATRAIGHVASTVQPVSDRDGTAFCRNFVKRHPIEPTSQPNFVTAVARCITTTTTTTTLLPRLRLRFPHGIWRPWHQRLVLCSSDVMLACCTEDWMSTDWSSLGLSEGCNDVLGANDAPGTLDVRGVS